MSADRSTNKGTAKPSHRPRPRNAWPVARFLLILAGGMLAFYVITAMNFFTTGVFPAYLELSARVAAGVLHVLGEDVSVNGAAIRSPRFALEIAKGCDALEPLALYLAGILAAPVAWRRKALGVLIGIPALLLLNLVRIVSLYYIGANYSADVFHLMHVDIWQAGFVFLTLALWVRWALWARRPPEKHTRVRQ